MINLITDLISFTHPTNLDRESLSVIESIAKIKIKVNECINEFNTLENYTDDKIKEFKNNLIEYKTECENLISKYNDESNAKIKEFTELIESLKSLNVTVDSIIKQTKYVEDVALNNQKKIDRGVIATKDETTEIKETIETLATKESVNEDIIQLNMKLDKKAPIYEIENLSKRIDTFTSLGDGSTSADAEIIDARNVNNKTYENVGGAIRAISNGYAIGDGVIKARKFNESLITNNLFDENAVTLNKMITINSNKEAIEINNEEWNLSELIPVTPLTKYKFKVFDYDNYSSGYRIIVYEFDIDKKYIGNSEMDTMTSGSFSGDKCKVFNTSVNCSFIKIQYPSLLNNYLKFSLMSNDKFNNIYTNKYIMPYASLKQIEEIKNKLKRTEGFVTQNYVDNALKSISFDNFVTRDYVESALENTVLIEDTKNKILVNSFNNTEDLITCYINSLKYDIDTANYRILMNKTDDIFSHDSTLVIDNVNGIAYIVYVANKKNMQDNPNSEDAFVRLNIIDLNNFSSSGMTVLDVCKINSICEDGTTLIKGTGVPNVILDNGYLYIMFSSKCSDGKWYMFKITYNTSSGEFSSIKKCNFSKNSVTFDFTTENIKNNLCNNITNTDTFISMNSQISKQGEYWYCGVTVDKQTPNGLIFRTKDFLTFEYWLEPNFSNPSNAIFECACYCTESHLYCALRQQIPSTRVDSTYMIIAKINLSTKNIEDEITIYDTSSRPCFFTDDKDNIYLAHSTNNRQRVEFIQINKIHLRDSKIVMQGSQQGVYPSIYKYGDYYYMSSTGNSCTAVYLRKFKLVPYDKNYVSSKFIKLFEITI